MAESLGGNTTLGGGIGIMLALTNNTGGNITSLNISFDVAQYWKTSTAQNMIFGYTTNSTTTLNSSTVDSNFSYSTATGSGQFSSGNSTSFNDTLTLSQPWANGTNLYLEWYLPAYTGTNHPDVGVQDISITAAVPEPSSLALLGGAVLLLAGIPLLRRRASHA